MFFHTNFYVVKTKFNHMLCGIISSFEVACSQIP